MKKILLFMVAALVVFGLVSCDQEVKTKTYKVSYNANGAVGNGPASIEVEEGGTITIPSCGSLSMKGYDFAGWNTKKDGSGRSYNESQSIKVDSDITLYAQWCIYSYSISYDLDGGSYPEGSSNPNKYTIETESFPLNNPEREGYEFLGWTISGNEKPIKNVYIKKGTTGDLSFVAVWRPLNSYSISYDVNGGEGSIETVLKLEGGSAEIALASEISRKGYEFIFWNTEPDGTGKDYNPGESYEEDEDLQLYAKWSIINYSIEYNLNGGKLAAGKSNPVEYMVETADIVLGNPTRYGYEFVGWRYKDDSDVLASTDFKIKKGTTGNLSIVAVWKLLDAYTVSYDTNGGTGTIETQSKYKGESLTISSCEGIGRNGYTFVCWNTKADGTGTDYNPNDAYSADADLRLYSKWNAVKYSITYDLDGGNFSDGSIIAEYTIETDTFTLPIPSKTEYEFKGWKAKVSDKAQKTVSIEKGSTGNLSFTAVWRKLNRYTVSYDANGGFGSIESKSKLEGFPMTISDAVGITRTGYSFVCWNTKSDGTGTDYRQNVEYSNDSDLVLYAKWSVVKYSITYDLAGGVLPEGKSNPIDYTIETETFTLVNPEKEGYIFEGWKESGSMDGTVAESVSITKGTTGNKSFIATWRLPKKYTVTFNANGADGGTPPASLKVGEGDFFTTPSYSSLYRNGYIFTGWNSKANGEGVDYLTSESIEVHEDITLYAIWKLVCLKFFYSSKDNSYYVVGCDNKDIVTIEIPSMYNGKLVTGISGFNNCTKLTSVTIPEVVTTIGQQAFSGCSGLSSITIPSSVMSIDDSAFYGCSNLTIVFSYGSTEIFAPKTCSSTWKGVENVSVLIAEGVTSIGDSAFSGCSGLESITIPESVTSIGDSAFSGCSGLESITIPESVTSIGPSAFRSCYGLTSIAIPGSVTNISDYSFYGCSGLTNILIAEGVKSIGRHAFYGCNGLTSVTIPEGVETIGNAFECCTGLKSIKISSSVTNIGKSAFSFCGELESIEVEAENTMYYSEGNCLIECDSKTLVLGCKSSVIPSSVTNIGENAFYGCSGLTSITIPESVTSIGPNAFFSCNELTNITIPGSVKSIWWDAFYGCNGLTSVTIPEGVTRIMKRAFSRCRGLKSIKLASSVTNIDGYAFSYCGELESIEVEAGNAMYYSEGNCLIECDSKTLVLGCKSSVIPSSVTNIGENAFGECSDLTSITIPEGVVYIGPYAFSNCGLTNITIPKSLKALENGAFSNCKKLNKITYLGTMEEWRGIKKLNYWNFDTGKYTIYCTDGSITK